MSYKETRSAYLNCEKAIYDGVGMYNIPEIQPARTQLDTEQQYIGFNFAIRELHPENKICHFYLDDYQFMRVWDNPNRYVPILQRFKAVLTPDFSLYMDFPKPLQIYNKYRTQWLGRYWQENGIDVIPTVNWSDTSSFEWCFDGIPKHSTVSISAIGGFINKEVKEYWLTGYKKALEVLQPSTILLWGELRPEIADFNFSGKMIVVNNSFYEKFKQMREGKQ